MRFLEIIRETSGSGPGINSLEQPIARSATGIARFSAWFGDSKVVDKKGRPQVMFHGTTGDFGIFDPHRADTNTGTGVPAGSFFFSNSAEVSATYAGQYSRNYGFNEPDHQAEFDRLVADDDYEAARKVLDSHGVNNARTWKPGGNVMPVYLRISNPLTINCRGSAWNNIYFEKRRWTSNELITSAHERGHDGLILLAVHDRMEGGGKCAMTCIVFSPNQIKSAIGNSGIFGQSHEITEGRPKGK